MDTKFSPEQAKQMLSGPEGKKLLAILSKNGGLQAAVAAFQKGDMQAVQEALSPTLQTREAQELLGKMNRK